VIIIFLIKFKKNSSGENPGSSYVLFKKICIDKSYKMDLVSDDVFSTQIWGFLVPFSDSMMLLICSDGISDD
jgi:hypothetical protein